jgi:phosphate transport system substrate-binding protein
VESTGTGGGIKLFCSGLGEKFPDVVNASRRMTKSELASCHDAGVTDVLELAVGIDGLVLSTSVARPKLSLTLQQIWLAMAEHGSKPSTWNEIDESLPRIPIMIYLPPPTSGTRDSFQELVLAAGCPAHIMAANKEHCELVRRDGAVIEVGENDALIVQKLAAEPHAIGIFGYSYLENNRDTIQAVSIKDVEASLETIQDGTYPIARPLYVYAKKAHIGQIPGLQDFLAEYLSEAASGDFGYLGELGLVPVTAEAKRAAIQTLQELRILELP